MMKHILLVDDEPEITELLAIALESEGYSVKITSSAEQALEYCSANTPDLIISDIKMGTMDGFTFFEKIHDMARLKNIPFIFVTAFDRSFDPQKAQTMKPTAFISKPFDLEEMVKTIKGILPPQ
jgi:two-component system OmpR family response regulator